MKKIKTTYWIITSLFVAFTLITSVSQITVSKNSEDVMNVLKFPLYMLPFLGAVKIIGLVAILIPVFNKVKEWAYAGFIFDYLGATYAMIAIGGRFDQWGFMIVPVLLCSLSYYFRNRIEAYKAERDNDLLLRSSNASQAIFK